MIRGCAIILGTFFGTGVLPNIFFGYLLRVFPDFWVSIFLVKFDFFKNNPDFWVLILILLMTLWNVTSRALVSDFLQSDLTYSCKKEWQ